MDHALDLLPDLGKRANITRDEQLGVGDLVLRLFLAEIYGRQRDPAILHGGMALRLAYESTRFSDDINLLMEPELVRRFDEEMPTLVNRTEHILNGYLPGSRLEAAPRKSTGAGASCHQLKWSHPNRYGKAYTRVEFMPVPQSALLSYAKRTMPPPRARAAGVPIPFSMSIASAEALWADKIVSLAARPELKLRDVYDLWFLGQLSEMARLGSLERANALSSAAAFTKVKLSSLGERLERRLQDPALGNADLFARNLKRYLARADFDNLSARGFFASILTAAKREVTSAQTALGGRTPRDAHEQRLEDTGCRP